MSKALIIGSTKDWIFGPEPRQAHNEASFLGDCW